MTTERGEGWVEGRLGVDLRIQAGLKRGGGGVRKGLMASEKVVPDKEVSELEVWAQQDPRSKLEGQGVVFGVRDFRGGVVSGEDEVQGGGLRNG